MEKKLFKWNQSVNVIYPNEENEFVVLNQKKKKGLLCESLFVPIDKRTLILKNGWKRTSSYETKASMSFILMSRMCFWKLIMRRKEIIMWIRICPNWQMNFNFKKWWEEKLFKWNQSFNVTYPNEWNEFMVPDHEKKRLFLWIYFCPNWQTNFGSKKLWEEKLLLGNQSINVIYPNKKNKFMVPNQEK